MSDPKNTGGQGNNQPAGNGKAKTSGAASAPTTIVQPGEDASVNMETGAPNPALAEFLNEANKQPPAAQPQDEEPKATAPVARELTNAEMTEMLLAIQKQQQTLMEAIMGRGTMARDRPVFGRNDHDQQADVPMVELDMPVEGSIDRMRRPDQRVEGVDIDVVADLDHAAMLLFLEELVLINIHESPEEGVEDPVVLGVNGRHVAIQRGMDTWVKRKYVELLLRAKPEAIRTKMLRNGDGDITNRVEKTRSLKYPFSIVKDKNPRGLAWARKIRAEA